MLSTAFEDSEANPGTHVMLDFPYPGGQFDRPWCEEDVEIGSDRGKSSFGGYDLITGR